MLEEHAGQLAHTVIVVHSGGGVECGEVFNPSDGDACRDKAAHDGSLAMTVLRKSGARTMDTAMPRGLLASVLPPLQSRGHGHSHDLSWQDAMALYQFGDSHVRGVFFMISLLLALLAYASATQRYVVIGISVFLILLTVAYSFYVYSKVNAVLRHTRHHCRLSPAYYYTTMVCIVLLTCFVVVRIDWAASKRERRLVFDMESHPKSK